MKRLMCYFLLILSLACNKEEKFDKYFYDGAYPRNMDGSIIKTYEPKAVGGEVEAEFNGHVWNHAPFMVVSAFVTLSPTTNEKLISVIISPYLTYQGVGESCTFESFTFKIPLTTEKVLLNEYTKAELHEYNLVSFRSINCDAIKDDYKLDRERTNWAFVRTYDPVTKVVQVEFDAGFKISSRNSNFGPIYPEHVNVRGKAKINFK
ncbi:hypothetical protein [Runella sp.]|uniref:hypothetical protein n=1 Tax=Runella sp. TaxID=1960881 RepID=UPI003D0AEAFB